MATKNIVPRATGEGNIGTSIKKWIRAFLSDGIYYDDTRGIRYNGTVWQYNNGSGWEDVGSGGGDTSGSIIHSFNVNTSTSPYFFNLPSGWSGSYGGGNFIITHNLNMVIGFIGYTDLGIPGQYKSWYPIDGVSVSAHAVLDTGEYNSFLVDGFTASNMKFTVYLVPAAS